jgi:hypothetical protein
MHNSQCSSLLLREVAVCSCLSLQRGKEGCPFGAARGHPHRPRPVRGTYFVFLRKILCFLREGWRFPKNPCFGPPQRFRAVAGLFVTWNPFLVYERSLFMVTDVFLCTFGAHVMFGLGFRYKGEVTACNASRRQSSPCHSKLMEETAAFDR